MRDRMNVYFPPEMPRQIADLAVAFDEDCIAIAEKYNEHRPQPADHPQGQGRIPHLFPIPLDFLPSFGMICSVTTDFPTATPLEGSTGRPGCTAHGNRATGQVEEGETACPPAP
jgi:hypothetical protein